MYHIYVVSYFLPCVLFLNKYFVIMVYFYFFFSSLISASLLACLPLFQFFWCLCQCFYDFYFLFYKKFANFFSFFLFICLYMILNANSRKYIFIYNFFFIILGNIFFLLQDLYGNINMNYCFSFNYLPISIRQVFFDN